MLGFEGFQKNLNGHSKGFRPLNLIILLFLEFAAHIGSIREQVIALAEKQRLHCLTIQTRSKEGILTSIRHVLRKHTEGLFGLTCIVNCKLACNSIELLETLKLFQIPCAWLFLSLQNLDLLIVRFPDGLGDITLNEEVGRMVIPRMFTFFIDCTGTRTIL